MTRSPEIATVSGPVSHASLVPVQFCLCYHSFIRIFLSRQPSRRNAYRCRTRRGRCSCADIHPHSASRQQDNRRGASTILFDLTKPSISGTRPIPTQRPKSSCLHSAGNMSFKILNLCVVFLCRSTHPPRCTTGLPTRVRLGRTARLQRAKHALRQSHCPASNLRSPSRRSLSGWPTPLCCP